MVMMMMMMRLRVRMTEALREGEHGGSAHRDLGGYLHEEAERAETC